LHEEDSRVRLIIGKQMKNLARLTLAFTVCFIAVFAASSLLNFLGLWVEAAGTVPFRPGTSDSFAVSGSKALPAALYITVLLGLSYTAREKMPVFFSIIGIFVLASVFTLGFALGMRHLNDVPLAPPAFRTVRGEPGLILSRADTSIILLKGSGAEGGPRVAALPGQPLIYQETPLGPGNTVLPLPSLPFRTEGAWFISSIAIDFDLVSREFAGRMGQSFFLFCIYAGSLVFLLSGLRFLLDLSQWPLANLFLGALAFRGVLALEIFLDTPEINGFLGSFLEGRLSGAFLTPLVFSVFGALVILYTLLAGLARAREK
jgi:hypothetical protein